MSIRVRLLSIPPLPLVKCWYTLPSTFTTGNISRLKSRLCLDLGQLADANIRSSELCLLLDEFDLLDNSALDVLRDGDTVCLKLSQTPSFLKAKRKASDDDFRPNGKRKRVASGPILPSNANRSLHQSIQRRVDPAPTSDESTSSNSSTSSSESDSAESENDTSKSDAGSSYVSPTCLHKKPSQAPRPAIPLQPLVAPGHGKPSTQRRNQRRRLKRKFDQPQTEEQQIGTGVLHSMAPDHKTNNTNFVTLGYGSAEAPAANDGNGTPPVMMASLRNKNKRRGFRELLNNPRPARIVFSDENTPDSMPNTKAIEIMKTIAKDASSKNAHFITPSGRQERGDLPPNMLVTSVDVEEGQWSKKGSKKWKEEIIDDPRFGEVESEVNLDYGDGVADTQEREHTAHNLPVFDFENAEQQWTQYSEVTDSSQLQVGTLVGWKALGINPLTFSPEMLLHVAQILSHTPEGITIRRIMRSGENDLAFGGRGEQDREPLDVEVEEIALTNIGDICAQGWRILTD